MRFFNTAGPVNCKRHYCINPLERIKIKEIISLIDQEKYFVIHAPRQTGKTSSLLELMAYLNRHDQYACLYMNVEAGQAAREDIAEGISSILRELASRAKIHLNDHYPESLLPQLLQDGTYSIALNQCFTEWAAKSDKPLVLLIDEIDALVGDTLISVLRQIRAGYDKRPAYFPQSIILCGVRDVQDYRIHSDREKVIITGGSAFNIKAKSLRLGNFSQAETSALLKVHTNETGQMIPDETQALLWEYSQGQPWLVNALAYETCFEMPAGRERSQPITMEMVVQAKENLILRRETHLDQLADKLRESRVRSVIEPILTGTLQPGDIQEDDLQYVVDLGLIRRKPHLTVSNPIYQEIIPRMLTESTQDVLPFQSQWYIRPDGLLDMEKLMCTFQDFFREHSEHWVERFQYKEAGPQLLLQAFLQRIVNSGGRIDREYGLGRKRTDLLIHWNHAQGVQKVVLELKILYQNLQKTIAEGLQQTTEYMDKCGSGDGHLIIFDRRPKRKWSQKIFQKKENHAGKNISVWGM